MANLSVVATRATVEVNKVWRKKQTKVYSAFNFMCEELEWLDDIQKEDVDWSARETLLMLDLNEGGRAGSLAEGGFKTAAVSPNLEEGTISVQHFDARFNITELAKWADKGNSNQLEKQIIFQAKKTIQGLGRHIADYIHGSSSGVLATTDTDITTSTSEQTLTLAAGYGNTAITDPAFITDKFRETVGNNTGDRIAIFDGSTLKGFGTVTARSTTAGTIGVTADNGAMTADTTNGLKIVKANSMEGTTEAGTDYQRGLVGFQDALTASALHGLTHGNWTAGFSDVNGGRLNGIRLRKCWDTLGNVAPEEFAPDQAILAQGVHRDMIAYERPALRFDSSFGMEVDGDIKSKGRTFRYSRRVPPGWTYVWSSKAVGKIMLTPMPDENDTGDNDGQPYQDRSLIVFDMPVVMGTVWRSRKALGYFNGLSEQ